MTAEGSAFTIPLETQQKLSASLVWEAQRRYFERTGVEAWRSQTVPHYITNNPRLAGAYADVVLGLVRDLEHDRERGLSPDQPLYIVELGAGCGRFGFFFLKQFSEWIARSHPRVRFRYVMTDFAESNLAFLRNHEALRPFVERGALDFARFDVEKDHEIRLEAAGETLTPGSLRHPLVVIADYVFDGVSQDAFQIQDGRLCEQLISIYSDVPAPDLSAPDAFEHLAVLYDSRPVVQPYYPEAEFNDILDGYAGSPEVTTILFPGTALRCVRRLAAVSRGGLMLIAGDIGDAEAEESFVDRREPAFLMHGSFSMNVNYQALGEYFVRGGGVVLSPKSRGAALHVAVFLSGPGCGDMPETRLAYEKALGAGGADDFFVLRHGIQQHYDKLDLPQLLAVLRLSGFDPRIMGDCLPFFWAQLQDAGATKEDVVQAALQVWQNYFHLGEEQDLAFAIGGLLYGMDEYQHALRLFEASCRLYGDDARTVWNMGLCHCGLGHIQEAVECFGRALGSEGGFRPRGGLQEKSGGC